MLRPERHNTPVGEFIRFPRLCKNCYHARLAKLPAPCGNYGFADRFAVPILQGRKTSTIRRYRKILPAEKGIMHLYTGWRTKNCMLIATAVIKYIDQAIILRHWDGGWEAVARMEGFDSADEMWDFLRATHRTKKIQLEDFYLTQWERLTITNAAVERWLGGKWPSDEKRKEAQCQK